MSIPAVLLVAKKKSKTLLSSIRLPTLLFGLADPRPMTPLLGRFAPAGPMLFFETVLLLLPPATVEVLNNTLPPATVVEAVDDPRIVQLVTVLFVAPPMNRIVLVPAVATALAFENVSELPPEFRPLMVTLSAPFKSINGVARVPETVRAPPE